MKRKVRQADDERLRLIASELRRMSALYIVRDDGGAAEGMWRLADGIDLLRRGFAVEVVAS